jgi:cytochrome c biogenesis protein ResB
MGTATRWLRNSWRILGSIRLAAALLFALLLASVLASLFPRMPEDPSVREPWLAAVKSRYGPVAGLWRTLGLFDVYRSPLFLALFVALLLNTLVCTVQRATSLCSSLTRAPVVIQSAAFYQKAALCAEWPVAQGADAVGIAQKSLARRGYRVRCAHDVHSAYLYAERGKWGRLGSPVSHAATIVLFVALLLPPALKWQDMGVAQLPRQGSGLRDPTFWPAIVAMSVFLAATLVTLWLPHRRLWLCVDAQGARMAGVGDFGNAFDKLAEMLSEACREDREGSDG